MLTSLLASKIEDTLT